jgi:hypothetical protein
MPRTDQQSCGQLDFSERAKTVLPSALEAPLLQCLRAFFQNFPRRYFCLKRTWKFPAFKAVKRMQSGQKPVVALISVLPHNNPNRVSLQFDDIGVRHKLTSRPVNGVVEVVDFEKFDPNRGSNTVGLSDNCARNIVCVHDLAVSSQAPACNNTNMTDLVNFTMPDLLEEGRSERCRSKILRRRHLSTYFDACETGYRRIWLVYTHLKKQEYSI